MAKNEDNKKRMRKSRECHETAAWANINKQMEQSKVSIPDEEHVKDAKEYVDSNQK